MNIKIPIVSSSEPRFWSDLKMWCQSVARRLNQNEKRIESVAASGAKAHPHQVLNTFDPIVVSSAYVKWQARAGYVYMNGTAYAHKDHVAGNFFDPIIDDDEKLDAVETYPVVSVYAVINELTGEWFYDVQKTRVVDLLDTYAAFTKIEVCRKVGIQLNQKIHSHIVIGSSGGSGSSGDTQLDHSWLPVQTSETQFSITKGTIYVGSLKTALLPTTATGLTIGTDYFIKVDWYSDINNPDVTWETSGGTDTDVIRYYPIIEFTGSTWDTLIRRQTNNLHIPNYPIPEMANTYVSKVLVFNAVTGVFEWVSAGLSYSVLQTLSTGAIGFDYVRVMA